MGGEKVSRMSSASDRDKSPTPQDNVRPFVAPHRVPNPEVSDRPKGRKFTKEYKAQILQQVENMRHGDVGAFLRREGLYTSHITEWRKQRDRALERWLEPQKPGPKPQPASELAKRVAQLEREKAKLEKRLKQAEAVIELQKKLSEILAIPLDPVESDENDESDS